MKQLTFILVAAFMAAVATSAPAQNNPRSEIALGYSFTRSNAPPAQCGCFHWQGGVVSAAVGIEPKWQLVGEFTGAHAGNQGVTSLKPTMFTFMGGPRYRFSDAGRVRPFANFLAGGTYAYNGYFVTTNSQLTVAVKTGGGFDLKVSRHWSVRPVEVSYLWTHYRNGVNDRQNNLVIGAGIVFRPGR